MSKKKLDCLKLINYIENSLEFKKLFNPRTKLLIAYSGGQDSTAVLIIFYILSKKWHFKLTAVYCNHGWHPKPASLNVFKMLMDYNIPFYYIDRLGSGLHGSENQARLWRYAVFDEIQKTAQYDFVLTGHTLTDKVETVLFNLTRGTGLKGINSLKSNQIFNISNLVKTNKTNPFYFKHQNLTVFDSITYMSCYFLCALNDNHCLDTRKQMPDFLFYCYTKKKVNHEMKGVFNTIFISLITFIHPTACFLTKRALTHCSIIKKLNMKPFRLQKQPFCFSIDHNFYKVNRLPVPVNKLLKRKANEKTMFFKQHLLIFIKPLTRKQLLIFSIKSFDKKKLTTCKKKRLCTYRLSKFYFILAPFFFYKTSNLITDQQNLKCVQTKPCFYVFFNKKKTRSYVLKLYQKRQPLIIVRPLINIRRVTITRFVQNLNLLIYFDNSNYDLTITRNYMRYKIFPLLKYINPKFEQNMYKFSQISSMYFNQMHLNKMSSLCLNYFID